MRNTFAPLDDLLIERLFQPLTDLAQHRLGLGRAAAACFCLDVTSLCWIASRASGLSGAVAAWDEAAAFFDLTLLLLGLIALIALRALFRREGVKQKNPLRPAMRPHRAIVLLMLAARLMQLPAPDLAGAADIAMLLFAAAALYLGACSEGPPVRRGWAALAPALIP
jgi:hypothetical protein